MDDAQTFNLSAIDDQENKQPLKKPDLSPDEVRKWLSRFKFVLSYHRKEIYPKYRQAKRRYNSEIGYSNVHSLSSSAKMRVNHNDINLLYKDVKEFIASIFFRNPEIDLTARNDKDPQEVAGVENLQQVVNDDISDRESELKNIFRSSLVDENLSSMAAIYIDYDYQQKPTGEPLTDENGQPVMDDSGQPMMIPQVITDQVMITKIRPENIIRPTYITFWNHKQAPYLGYCDIVSLETLKNDPTLDQELVKQIKGASYKSLIDAELRDNEKEKNELRDDMLHAKVYVGFIRGSDDTPIKRLVLSDDPALEGKYLDYSDWDKGHGYDDRGFPIHILQLNDAADSFVPPSEAWILEPILQIIDNIFSKLNRHIKKASTRYLVKTGQSGMEKAEIEKWIRNSDLEVLGVENLPPGIDVRTVVNQIVDQPLSQDHEAMLALARQIFDNLSRRPSFSQPSIINQKKTATESENIQQTDSTENGDYIDKFKDFLKDIFYDWAKLRQRNMQKPKDLTIVDKFTGEKISRPGVTADSLQGKFKADIDVTSFLPPNKALKRQQVREIVGDMATILPPILKQTGQMLNGQKVLQLYTQNLDMRNTSDLTIPVPIREIDQQVTDYAVHGVPMNPNELGDDEKSLNRLAQIFSDDKLMATFEQTAPGISGQGSPLIGMLEELQARVEAKKSGKPMKSPAKSPIHQGAGLMASAQQ